MGFRGLGFGGLGVLGLRGLGFIGFKGFRFFGPRVLGLRSRLWGSGCQGAFRRGVKTHFVVFLVTSNNTTRLYRV